MANALPPCAWIHFLRFMFSDTCFTLWFMSLFFQLTLSKLFQSLSAFLHTMSLRGKIVRLCQAGAAGGLVTALTVQLLDRDNRTSLGSKFLVNAKSRDFSQVNDLYQGMGVKWDSNWDHRHELTNYGILLIIWTQGACQHSQASEGQCNWWGESCLWWENQSKHSQSQQNNRDGEAWPVQPGWNSGLWKVLIYRIRIYCDTYWL